MDMSIIIGINIILKFTIRIFGKSISTFLVLSKKFSYLDLLLYYLIYYQYFKIRKFKNLFLKMMMN